MPLLPKSQLAGDTQNRFAVSCPNRVTHLRFKIYPDGGVARLRVHGDVAVDWSRLARRGDVDLGAAEHGGLVVACSDMFFGSRHNLIMPGDARHMGVGWETKRRRGPGHDWTIVKLGTAGTIRRVEVDTRHFKGNAPGSCMIECCDVGGSFDPDKAKWTPLLPQTPLEPHSRHVWDEVPTGSCTLPGSVSVFGTTRFLAARVSSMASTPPTSPRPAGL